MEDQKQLQLEPEVMEIAETEITKEEEEQVKVMKEEEYNDEEFYEKIEAPKFVDFTKPYTVRTDDRYWFCSRVGCDQKHEEEINPEEISKNFVLRVLAARSPNIKLRKALNREHVSMKCPFSAPAKPSKPRIPRLPMVSSLISHKNGDKPSKTGICSKDGSSSTPVAAKTRQVAAKYMTTPRNKMCRPDPNSFRSVQNPKKTSVDVTKNRPVAKALVFHSPKKVICIKRSVELQTPLTKICQGMKRLEIASKKKTVKTSTETKPKKSETEDLSKRKLKRSESDNKYEVLASSKSTKTPKKKILSKECDTLHEKVVENEPADVDVDHSDEVVEGDMSKNEEDLKPQETSDPSVLNALRAEMNELSNLEDKENIASAEDNSNEVVGDMSGHKDDNDDGKENALNPPDNIRSNNQPLGDKILSKEIQKKNKIVQAVVKCKKPKPTNIKPFRLRTDERGVLREANLEKKLHVTVSEKKPKPTNIKPFRLRTDERGVLREANLEKKLHVTVSEKKLAKDSSVIKRTIRVAKNDKFPTSNIFGKESSAVESKPATNAARKRPESTKQRFVTSSRTRTQGMPGQQLCTIKEKSCKLASDVMMAENKNRAVCGARSTSRGKRPLTIAKEPNFHTSHMPRTCSKNIA